MRRKSKDLKLHLDRSRVKASLLPTLRLQTLRITTPIRWLPAQLGVAVKDMRRAGQGQLGIFWHARNGRRKPFALISGVNMPASAASPDPWTSEQRWIYQCTLWQQQKFITYGVVREFPFSFLKEEPFKAVWYNAYIPSLLKCSRKRWEHSDGGVWVGIFNSTTE